MDIKTTSTIFKCPDCERVFQRKTAMLSHHRGKHEHKHDYPGNPNISNSIKAMAHSTNFDVAIKDLCPGCQSVVKNRLLEGITEVKVDAKDKGGGPPMGLIVGAILLMFAMSGNSKPTALPNAGQVKPTALPNAGQVKPTALPNAGQKSAF